jgi:hypothetical protein
MRLSRPLARERAFRDAAATGHHADGDGRRRTRALHHLDRVGDAREVLAAACKLMARHLGAVADRDHPAADRR